MSYRNILRFLVPLIFFWPDHSYGEIESISTTSENVYQSSNHLNEQLSLAKELQYINLDSAQTILLDLEKEFSEKNMKPEQGECLHMLGRISAAREQFDKAALFYHRASLLFEANEDRKGQLNVFADLGDLYQSNGQQDSAAWYFNEINENWSSVDSKPLHARAQIGLAIDSYRKDQIDTAFINLKRAISIASETNQPHLLMKAFQKQGFLYLQSNQLDSSLNDYQRALSYARQSGDSIEVSRTLRQLGTLYSKKKNLSASLHSLVGSLELIEALKVDLSQKKRVLFEIALIYRWTEDWSKAVVYYEKILSELRAEDDKRRAMVFMNLAVPRIKLKQFAKAQEELIKAEIVYDNINNYSKLAGVYNNLGLIHYEQQQYADAAMYFEKAVNNALEVDKPTLQIECYNSLASARYFLGQYEQALTTYNKAKIIAEKEGLLLTNYHLLMGLAETLAKQKQYNRAYNTYLEYTHLKDSIFDQDKLTQLRELQEKYDSERKAKDIEVLTAKNALIQSQSEAKTLQSNILILILVLFAVILFAVILLFRNRRQSLKMKLTTQEERSRSEINQLLAQQEIEAMNAMINGREQERQRIAADLHDRIGGLLSTSRMHVSAIHEQKDKQHTKALETLETAYHELRSISHRMDTSFVVRLGLNDALEDLKESIISTQKIDFHLFISEENRFLNKSWEVALYSIVLELVNNVLKHANASELIVQLIFDTKGLTLMVEDNGKGFNVNAIDPKEGIGLRSLKARVAKANGHMVVDSQLGKGATTIIEFSPLPQDAYTQTVRKAHESLN